MGRKTVLESSQIEIKIFICMQVHVFDLLSYQVFHCYVHRLEFPYFLNQCIDALISSDQ